MQNKFNIDDVNAWLKEEYGMSYDDLSKEFNKVVDLLSESLKQRKEMRNKIEKGNMKEKEKITEKYKKIIKEIYKFQYDKEIAHGLRDNIYRDFLEELGYKELADLLEKSEEDIGFWYA